MPFVKDVHREINVQKLSKEELEDPYLVIDELFDFAHLPEIRELLWEWLKTTVIGSFPKKLTATERSAILGLYEKIEKLIEAVQVIQNNKKLNIKKRRKIKLVK